MPIARGINLRYGGATQYPAQDHSKNPLQCPHHQIRHPGHPLARDIQTLNRSGDRIRDCSHVGSNRHLRIDRICRKGGSLLPKVGTTCSFGASGGFFGTGGFKGGIGGAAAEPRGLVVEHLEAFADLVGAQRHGITGTRVVLTCRMDGILYSGMNVCIG